MLKLKFRICAAMAAAALASGTIVGALALQDDPAAHTPNESRMGTEIVEDAPILYAGGYGLFPSR